MERGKRTPSSSTKAVPSGSERSHRIQEEHCTNAEISSIAIAQSKRKVEAWLAKNQAFLYPQNVDKSHQSKSQKRSLPSSSSSSLPPSSSSNEEEENQNILSRPTKQARQTNEEELNPAILDYFRKRAQSARDRAARIRQRVSDKLMFLHKHQEPEKLPNPMFETTSPSSPAPCQDWLANWTAKTECLDGENWRIDTFGTSFKSQWRQQLEQLQKEVSLEKQQQQLRAEQSKYTQGKTGCERIWPGPSLKLRTLEWKFIIARARLFEIDFIMVQTLARKDLECAGCGEEEIQQICTT